MTHGLEILSAWLRGTICYGRKSDDSILKWQHLTRCFAEPRCLPYAPIAQLLSAFIRKKASLDLIANRFSRSIV